MAKDDRIYIRINGELKAAAQDYAKETGRSLAGLIEYLLRQELKTNGGFIMKKLDVNEIYEIIREKYDESDIVSAAMAGFVHGYKSGQAVFDIEKHTIYTRSVGTGEYVQNDKDVILYTVDQNILGNESFADEDWLTEKEISDWESRDMGRQEYIEKHTNDTVESRLQEILEHYFEWDDVYEKIKLQVGD
jgi:hypothetical protein